MWSEIWYHSMIRKISTYTPQMPLHAVVDLTLVFEAPSFAAAFLEAG